MEVSSHIILQQKHHHQLFNLPNWTKRFTVPKNNLVMSNHPQNSMDAKCKATTSFKISQKGSRPRSGLPHSNLQLLPLLLPSKRRVSRRNLECWDVMMLSSWFQLISFLVINIWHVCISALWSSIVLIGSPIAKWISAKYGFTQQ